MIQKHSGYILALEILNHVINRIRGVVLDIPAILGTPSAFENKSKHSIKSRLSEFQLNSDNSNNTIVDAAIRVYH